MKKIVSAAMTLLLAAGVAWGQEEVNLPDITVTASRWDSQILKVPQQITVIDRQQIEAMHPNNVVDVLRYAPGVVVRSHSGNGLLATVDMRGFAATTSQHVLVLLDGRRLNPIDMSGVDFSTIAVDSIERIEVLHGSSAVLYGEGAVAGVINIISREGLGAPATTLEVRGGSYEMGEVRATTKGSHDMLSWFGQAHYGGAQGYRDNNEQRTRGVGLNLRVDPSDTFSFLLDSSYDEAHYSLPGALSEADMNEDRQRSTHSDDWASRQSFNIRGQARKDWQEGGVLTADIFYRDLDSDSLYMNSNEPSIGDSTIHNFGIQPKYSVQYNIGSLPARTTAGIDYNYWKVTSDASGGGAWTPGQNEYFANSVAGYLLEEISFTNDLHFNLGGRVHYATYDVDSKPLYVDHVNYDPDETQYAWTVGLTYNILDVGKAYASAGRTFRYPLVDEYVSGGIFNADLDAEYGMDYEIGTQFFFPCGLTASLNFYWMDMKDEIAYNSLTNLNENLDDTVHRGFDLTLSMALGEKNQHMIFANVGYQNAEYDGGQYDGNRIPLVPEWSGSLGGAVEIIDNLRFNARVNLLGERYYDGDNNNQGEKMSAYATVDLGADYTWENFTVFANVQNLFNRYYSDYGYYAQDSLTGADTYSYYPTPGTIVWGGIKIKI